MNRQFFRYITPALIGALLSPLPAQAQDAPAHFHAVKIVLVGDSTTAVHSGWGSSFCGFHLTSFAACINLARGGRSSGNYRSEGSWALALDEMRQQGFDKTYVLIQFGHNDQPGKPGRSTDLATEFPANMARYVAEARAAGAIPVLVTPLTRRQFRSGQIEGDLAPWAEALRKVAARTQTPLVDLYAHSQAAVQAMGPVAAMRLAQMPPSPAVLDAARDTGTTIPAHSGLPMVASTGPSSTPPAQNNAATEPMGQAKLAFDYTHLGREGADYFAAMVAHDLAEAVPDLSHYLIP